MNLAEAEPVLAALAEIGFPVGSFAELRRVADYTRALPLLLEWLPRVSRRHVQGDIVRCLSVPTAVEARRPLLAMFTRLDDDGLRWELGNALGELACDEIATELFGLVREAKWGIARQMIVLGLAKLRTPGTDDVLLELLDDPDVEGHALEALLARKAAVSRARVAPFLTHKQAWTRRIAKKLLRYSV